MTSEVIIPGYLSSLIIGLGPRYESNPRVALKRRVKRRIRWNINMNIEVQKERGKIRRRIRKNR
jgi:hypothetical protein